MYTCVTISCHKREHLHGSFVTFSGLLDILLLLLMSQLKLSHLSNAHLLLYSQKFNTSLTRLSSGQAELHSFLEAFTENLFPHFFQILEASMCLEHSLLPSSKPATSHLPGTVSIITSLSQSLFCLPLPFIGTFVGTLGLPR